MLDGNDPSQIVARSDGCPPPPYLGTCTTSCFAVFTPVAQPARSITDKMVVSGADRYWRQNCHLRYLGKPRW